MRVLLRFGKYFFAFTPLFLFGFFLFWLFRVVYPIVIIESKYQLRAIVKDIIRDDVLKIIFPSDFLVAFNSYSSNHNQAGIRIPKIYLDEPVIFNVDPNISDQYTLALKKGIAHASATSIPGEIGLGYYFAHSSSVQNVAQYNAVFYLLGKLEANDDIYIWREGSVHKYKVTTKVITSPEDIAFLKIHYSEETIVLQTCWPPGTTQKRLLVFAQKSGTL